MDLERGIRLPTIRERDKDFSDLKLSGNAWARFPALDDIQFPRSELSRDRSSAYPNQPFIKDGDSLCSKNGFVGETDQMTLVDGVYVLALESDADSNRNSVRH